MAIDKLENVIPSRGTGYTKFPDGTLLCFGRESVTTTPNGDTTKSVSFNQTFTSAPYVIAQQGSDSNTWGYVTVAATTITATGFTLKTHSFESSSANIKISYIAVGRWK